MSFPKEQPVYGIQMDQSEINRFKTFKEKHTHLAEPEECAPLYNWSIKYQGSSIGHSYMFAVIFATKPIGYLPISIFKGDD